MSSDAAVTLESILAEADALIRKRLEEAGLVLPHVVLGVTSQGQFVLRNNVPADVLRAFGDDLKFAADNIETSPRPGQTRR